MVVDGTGRAAPFIMDPCSALASPSGAKRHGNERCDRSRRAPSQLCMISLNFANQSFWCSTRIGVGIDNSRAKSSSLVG